MRLLRGQTAGSGQGSLTLARIALDAMGGDRAPASTVAGALLALGDFGSRHVIQLVGRQEVIRAELQRQLAGDLAGRADDAERLQVVHAPDVIEMSDRPSVAIRGKN